MDNFKEIPLESYEKIPENDRKLFDLKIDNVTYDLLGKSYLLDLGINRVEVDKPGNADFWYSSRIIDQGDLSTYYGYNTMDATGFTVRAGRIYPETVKDVKVLEAADLTEWLKAGYTYVRMENIPQDLKESPFPINIIGLNYKLPEFNLEVGINPTFLLEKEGRLAFAVINGFLIDLTTGQGTFKNALIYR
jgi:hypothetical protein